MAFKTKYPNCRHNFGRTRPVARFQDLGGTHTFLGGKIFVIIICLKQKFLSTTKFGGAQTILGGNCPEYPLCLRSWEEPSPESLPLGAFMFVQGLDILKIYF